LLSLGVRIGVTFGGESEKKAVSIKPALRPDTSIKDPIRAKMVMRPRLYTAQGDNATIRSWFQHQFAAPAKAALVSASG
jgi:hypothetical protein